MNGEIAFIGDVHGNLQALQGITTELLSHSNLHLVFLGDYINKGPHSAEVVDELIALSRGGRATLLLGNHEETLLEALDTEDLTAFLKMGGAATIRSYVGGRVGPDVLEALADRMPAEHVDALRAMPRTWESDEVLARHAATGTGTTKYLITAHVPVGDLPRVRPRSADLDTGCCGEGGRLTALAWPSLDYVQVDAKGDLVPG